MGLFSRKKKDDRSAKKGDAADAAKEAAGATAGEGGGEQAPDEAGAPSASGTAAGGDGSATGAIAAGGDSAGAGGGAAAGDGAGAGDDSAAGEGAGDDSAAGEGAAAGTDGAASGDTASVNISLSAFQGLGSTGADARPAQLGDQADTNGAAAPGQAPAGSQPASVDRDPSGGETAAQAGATRRPPLPAAPAAPPTDLETVPGLRDNALVRDALDALPEKPTGAEVMGVIRQMMQGHLYLRVQGDARKTLAEGGQVTFGVAKAGGKDYMMVFSSGRALRDAVKVDGDAQTSAVAQPTPALIKHMLAGTFAGMIVDNYSKGSRAVLPREILEKALNQADPKMRLKNLLAQPRDAETPGKLAAVLAEKPPLWVAVGEVQKDGSDEDDKKAFGVAEARLADGTRLLQVFSHPLEVVALSRPEKAMPLAVDKIAKMLKDHDRLGGVIIDPAGPLMTLTREELAPVIALAE
ncbi:SseB family protein [Microbacterium halophytorum]|uniref:SseB family protein n=1 Tax=Microbacterium halophytorum TaxID=2067568 RepID=UPI000CFC3E8A|nr:SseB family protein [Microbacterium halophytorum]